MSVKGNVFEIRRFAVHDGNGIRTTIFLKGCPLRCIWCHNPEGLARDGELAFFDKRCIGCGACVNVCGTGAHTLERGGHIYERDLCVGCGKCADVCVENAVVFYGREYSVKELLDIALTDKDFYDATGGGVTLSGGECLLQADFCAALLKKLKENGINTAVDTCGAVSRRAIEQVLPYTDMFLYDIKAYDEEVHIRCTGSTNRRIIENLKIIDGYAKPTEIRFPLVPGYNDDQAKKAAELLATLSCVTGVRVLPYHFPGAKYEVLGKHCSLRHIPADEEAVALCKKHFRDRGIHVF